MILALRCWSAECQKSLGTVLFEETFSAIELSVIIISVHLYASEQYLIFLLASHGF